jgi:hypothetical protein
MSVTNRLSSLPLFGPDRSGLALSRRDYRTQPGVLTPGTDQRTFRPHKALRTRPRPRIRPRGVMEYWSVGVLRQVRIAHCGRGVGGAEGAVELVLQLYAELSRANHRSKISYAPSGRVVGWACSPGLKPRAESYYPFGICSASEQTGYPEFSQPHLDCRGTYRTICPGPNTDANRQPPDQERQSK